MSQPRFTSPSPHRLDPLVGIVANLCPDLSGVARRRVAEMANTIREVSDSQGGCTRDDLVRAGFTADEIKHCQVLAQEALAGFALPDEAISAFSLADATTLRRFTAARAAQQVGA